MSAIVWNVDSATMHCIDDESYCRSAIVWNDSAITHCIDVDDESHCRSAIVWHDSAKTIHITVMMMNPLTLLSSAISD